MERSGYGGNDGYDENDDCDGDGISLISVYGVTRQCGESYDD